MASACTDSGGATHTTNQQQHSDKCAEVATSPSRHRGGGVPRSPNKRHVPTSNILMPPPGTLPRIPPFPGMVPPPPSIYFPAIPPPPMPSQQLYIAAAPPPPPPPPSLYQQPQTMVYQKISESNGYRLMVNMPVGHREDGTYGILTCGVRPDQEYRYYTYYVNSVTYYNLPPEVTGALSPSQAM